MKIKIPPATFLGGPSSTHDLSDQFLVSISSVEQLVVRDPNSAADLSSIAW